MSDNIGSIKGTIGLDDSDFTRGIAESLKSIEELVRSSNDAAKELAAMGETAGGFEVLKMGMEAVAKAGEFMEQGIKDATALGNGPAREMGETLEKVGLAGRQLGADLMSNLAPAFNSLIKYFTDGVDFGKILANVAGFLGDAFRATVAPIVAVAGAIKGLIEGGSFESAMDGAAAALQKLAEHGKDFSGSMKAAAEQAAIIAGMQKTNSDTTIYREATRMQSNFDNLSGNRRQDKFAGAAGGNALANATDQWKQNMQGISDATAKTMAMNSLYADALKLWKRDMEEAADWTAKAAVADSLGQKIQAEADREQAAQATQSADAAKLSADGWRAAKEKLIVDAAEINKIQLGLSESLKNIGVGANIKSQKYHNDYDPTAGFKDFDDALAKQTQALDNQAGLVAAASVIQQQYGPSAQATVDALNKEAANQGLAAQAAGAAADAFFAVKDKLKQQLISALQTAGESFLSNIGQLGSTINDVIKGAQQGGIWGALAAAIMDLLAQLKGFSAIQDIAKGQLTQLLGVLSSGLGSIMSALHPLMGALGFLTNIVGELLNPILGVIGQVLQGIAPLFVILGMVLQPLGEAFKSVSSVISTILKPVLQALAYVFIGIGEVMLAIQVALSAVWLALLTGADEFLKAFGNHSLDQARDDANAALQANIAQMNALGNTNIAALMALANQSADTSEALGATADAANSVTQALLNVPQGFKVAYAEYSASTAVQNGSGPQTSTRSNFRSTGNPVQLGKYPRTKS